MSSTVGFIGLGNVGGKLAGNLLANAVDLSVHDLDPAAAETLTQNGAGWADTPAELADMCDVVITCLPSPAASAASEPASPYTTRWPSTP